MSETIDDQLAEIRTLSRARWLDARAKEAEIYCEGVRPEQQGTARLNREGVRLEQHGTARLNVRARPCRPLVESDATSPHPERPGSEILDRGPFVNNTKKRQIDPRESAEASKKARRCCELDVCPEKIDLLSWNLDGLMEKELPARTLAVIDEIRKLKPALILLQEVVSLSEMLIRKYLSGPYKFAEAATRTDWTPAGRSSNVSEKGGYYCLMLISKFHFKSVKPSRTYFYPESAMARHLLTVEVELQSESPFEIVVGTTHLESCKSEQEERLRQLQTCIEWMSSELIQLPRTALVLLAGDFNIRDSELKSKQDILNGLGIKDAWIETGSSKSTQFTWDMLRNKNLDAKGRCRFDRIWFYRGEDCPMRLQTYKLVGTSIIDERSLPMHPSDHFGMLAGFVSKC